MGKVKRGRPSGYDTTWRHRLPQIEGWARDGLIDTEIADKMGIGVRTLYEWKNKYPDFSQSLKKGKEVVDYEVEKSLLKRAMGYEYEEVKVIEEVVDGNVRKRVEKVKRHMAGDPTAIIFWLKNRKGNVWNNGMTDMDKLQQELVIEKLQAQIETIRGVKDTIENTVDLRRLLGLDED